jgi:hypothetical protein
MFSRSPHRSFERLLPALPVGCWRRSLLFVLVLGCGQAESERPAAQGGDEPSTVRGDEASSVAEHDASSGTASGTTPGTAPDAASHTVETTQQDTDTPNLDADVGEQPTRPDAARPAMNAPDASGEQAEPASDPSRAGGPCPDTPPELGAACEPWGTFCTYDSTSDVAGVQGCRQAYSCHATGVWTSASVPGVELCVGPPPEQCAETVLTGQVCEAGALTCTSEGATCECTTGPLCSPDGQCADPAAPRDYAWACRAQQAECPWVPDNAGVRCEDATSRCLYGDPCGGVYVVCVDGYTEWESALCP